MTAEQKIEFVKAQIDAPVVGGELITITCPYCDVKNVQGQNFCCDLLRKCVEAIVNRMENEVFMDKMTAHA